MNQGKTYYQLIPEKVLPILGILRDLIEPEINGFSLDCLKEVISIVACHVQKSDGLAPLKMVFLRKLVPQADRYLSCLIDTGIIIREGTYLPGEVSYKYRFAPEYQSKYSTLVLSNMKLIHRIESVQNELRKEAETTLRGYLNQTKYLKRLTLSDEYLKFIENNYSPETSRYNYALGSATRIMNGDIFYSVDSTSGRFHSNLTNISKGLRPYLRIQGEPLTNIDIKNSQPYLSTIVLTNPSKVSWMTENPVFALLLQSLKVSLNQDVKLYINLVVLGQLYEYLMTEFTKEGLTLTRDETKRQVLRILFARNRMPKDEANREARRIFKDRFPTVHRIFSKVRGHCKGNKFENYKRFAILLQRIESYLMLDVILKRIYKELPGTIAVTVHDSIMTGVLTNNVEAVRKIMTEELSNFVGLLPKLKVEKENIENKEGELIIINQYGATTFVNSLISAN